MVEIMAWMARKRMLKIREFSQLARVTVKALHLYDRLGLLQPAEVDAGTGYRFYTLHQLPRLNRILVLKDLGFSLDEIRSLLDEDPPPAEMRGMLRLKRAELERQVAEGRARLARVEARLRQIEREGKPLAYDIALKEVAPMTVASARSREATHAQFIRFSNEVPELVARRGVRTIGPVLTLFYHEEFREHDFNIEVAVPVASGTVLDVHTSKGQRVQVRELTGAARMAYCIWSGGDPLVNAYLTIGTWIADNGYRVAGPAREIYLRAGDSEDPVFEIQYPVADA
jgi:DNA-binding transcriptional MerR regulator